MERLTYSNGKEWEIKGADGAPCDGVCENRFLSGCRDCPIQTAFDRLAAYEDIMPLERAQELAQAEKDGRMVLLPCKVGDTLYIISNEIIEETKVRTFFLGHPSHNIEKRKMRMIRTIKWDIPMEEIGKRIFFTREEAEAALKKREEADDEAD